MMVVMQWYLCMYHLMVRDSGGEENSSRPRRSLKRYSYKAKKGSISGYPRLFSGESGLSELNGVSTMAELTFYGGQCGI